MWWMPLIQLGMNKMAEQKALEEARKQQLHSIRSGLSASFGTPQYGPNTAKMQYDTQRQIDADRRARNSQLLQSAFSSMGDGAPEEPVYGPGVDPPSPDGDDAYEDAEVARARAALKGFK